MQEDDVRLTTKSGFSGRAGDGGGLVRLMMAAGKCLSRERMKLGDFVRLNELQSEVASDRSQRFIAGWVDG